MSERTTLPGDSPARRGLNILIAAVVTVSFLGFLAGTGSHERPEPEHATTSPDPNMQSPHAQAPSYLGLRTMRIGPNRGWFSDLAALRANLPGRYDAVIADETAAAAAFAERMGTRAYDGAPPTIPHPINDSGLPECIACHAEGLRVDERNASAISHPYLANCTQCHVLDSQTFGGRPTEGALEHAQSVGGANVFGGHVWPRHGQVAWAGAPPTIPHPTWMRQECMSCHGDAGRNGLRTPHPERQSCQQCHAPDAALDQRPTPPTLEIR